jgi:nitrogen fixation protein FixH
VSRKAATWIGLVIGLLLLDVVLQGTILVCALNDPSFAVEADYEWQAEHWDDVRRERDLSLALGWSVDLRAVPSESPGEVRVELDVADRGGAPVTGARVEVLALHNARASRIHTLRLASVGHGRYRETAALERPGVWEFRVAIDRGPERYVGRFRESVEVRAIEARP